MKTIVVGLGNELLKDDGVGIEVARRVKEKIPHGEDVDVFELGVGGLMLVEVIAGYKKAIIVDSMKTCNMNAGQIKVLSVNDIVSTKNVVCAHDTDLATALEIGRLTDMELPEEIIIIGIEAKDTETFDMNLTEEVRASVQEAVDLVIGKINCNQE